MKEEELAYIAGYLDADGCITIYRRKPTNTNGQKNPIHYPDIHISSINQEIIKMFKDLYGGCITKDTSQHKNPLYNWKPNISDMKNFLLSIRPYIKLKKQQCDIMINFLEERESSKRQCLSREQLDRREKCLQDIQRGNQYRGE